MNTLMIQIYDRNKRFGPHTHTHTKRYLPGCGYRVQGPVQFRRPVSDRSDDVDSFPITAALSFKANHSFILMH